MCCVHTEHSAGLLKWIKWSKWGLWRRTLHHYSEWYSCYSSPTSSSNYQKWERRRKGGDAMWEWATLLQRFILRALMACKLPTFLTGVEVWLNKHNSKMALASICCISLLVVSAHRAAKIHLLHSKTAHVDVKSVYARDHSCHNFYPSKNPHDHVGDLTVCWHNVCKVPLYRTITILC